MLSGIYALWWDLPNLIYIGQSQDIARRFKDHGRELANLVHCNYKLQNTYNEYGKPEYIILELCSLDKLYELEKYYTYEFDSLNSGLNIVEPGLVGKGINSSNSRYTKIKILRVFVSIYKYKRTREHISTKYNVPTDLIKRIAGGRSHLWLKEEYPKEYSLMKEVSTKIRGKGGSTNKVVLLIDDPQGNTHVIFGSLTDFCRTIPEFNENLKTSASTLSQMKAGVRKEYKKWTNLRPK